jgi:small GTP-binding protein
MEGKIVTFYSYKGGTGRSMALANIAWVLAMNGKRVLAIDWDLEAPGLHRYFLPFLSDPELAETPGLIEIFWSYTDMVLAPRDSWPPGIEDPLMLADAQQCAVPLEYQFPNSNACIHFLGAGCQEASYSSRVRSFDWQAFYERLGGSQFVEALRKRSLQQYDYVLIDSRTGVADTSGICTMQMPDIVVLCFTYNRQSMKGVEAVAKSIQATRGKQIKILPIAMRAERSVQGYKEARQVARELLDPLLASQFDAETIEKHWKSCEVPHYPNYAFEETLAVFKDQAGQRNTLLSDMVWLAETLQDDVTGSIVIPDLTAAVRERYLRRFALRDPRLSQLEEIQELPVSDAYRQLAELAISSREDSDDHNWMLAVAGALDKVADKLQGQGVLEQALAATKDSVDVLKSIKDKNQEDYRLFADALIKLAAILEEIGRYREALDAINQAIDVYNTLASEQPELAANLASTQNKLGTLLAGMGRWLEASEAFQQSIREYKRLSVDNSETFEPDLARGFSNLGRGYTELRRPERAYDAFLRGVDSYERLAHRNPQTFESNLASCLKNLGVACSMLDKHEEANNAFQRAAAIYNHLPQLYPEAFELEASGHGLKELPSSIGQLTQLRTLNLSDNSLTELPESIGQLFHLRHLNISDNRLVVLPECLKWLTSLEELYLHGNTALGIPAEILGSSHQDVLEGRGLPAKPADILDYYFRVRGGKRTLNEAKLILVGRGAVGKTSIVNRLVHERFNKSEKKTEGIQITEWELWLNGNEDVRLNIWDFGGQEIMHATHQFFLTQRSLYLLVLNGREGNEDADAEYWLKLIESFAGDSPVIIVLNKINEHPFDVNRRGLQRKYPAIREFIKTDCADGTGIEYLHKAIERETDRLEHLRDAFPISWFNIKDQLARMKTNYLSFRDYREICNRLGEKDRTAQESLAGYLHNLGIILNYRDDPRLQDTHVLNPHWVTNGIYKILNSYRLEKQKGEIHLSDLSAILDPSEYPANMHRFIFDLMKKFDLCFSFPEDDEHYLIPELLDKQEPAEAEAFKLIECLNFQYHYTILPEGLLPRFIVRTHVLSEGLPRWRTGVIMKFEGNFALVKADAQDRKVFISISGLTSGRRRLLAVIRSDFERIHLGIPNLQPREMVPVPEHPDLTVSYADLQVMEQHNVRQYPVVVNGIVMELDVQDLLNGVDLEGTRRRENPINN